MAVVTYLHLLLLEAFSWVSFDVFPQRAGVGVAFGAAGDLTGVRLLWNQPRRQEVRGGNENYMKINWGVCFTVISLPPVCLHRYLCLDTKRQRQKHFLFPSLTHFLLLSVSAFLLPKNLVTKPHLTSTDHSWSIMSGVRSRWPLTFQMWSSRSSPSDRLCQSWKDHVFRRKTMCFMRSRWPLTSDH